MSEPTIGGPPEPPDRDRPTVEGGATDRDPGRPTVEHGGDGGDRDPRRPTREAGQPLPETSAAPTAEPPGEELPDRLPPELEALIRDRDPATLVEGGQANVVRAIWRADGSAVAVKTFHSVRPELEAVWARWRQARHENIIPLLHAGNYRYHAYEVMPYALHGTLSEHYGPDRPLRPNRAEAVLRQIGSALNYLHTSTPQWLHLDVKPSNILVTSLEPFTVVLADFGVSRLQEYTEEPTRAGAKSALYSAPEAFENTRSASLDWWALGMTLLEGLNGRHPFVDGDGRALSDFEINRQVHKQDVPIEGVDGWLQPLRGLLARVPEQRWAFEQVSAWLDGQTVPEPAPVTGRSAVQHPPFDFAGSRVTDPRELAALMARNWTAAGDLLSGTWTRLVTWAEAVSPELAAALRTVEADYALARRPIDRTVCEVIARLDPQASPVFRGRPATRDALLDVLAEITGAAATDHRPDRAWIAGLYETRALVALSRHDGHGELANADEDWLRWHGQAQDALRRCPLDPDDVPGRTLLQSMLLAAALDRETTYALRDRAEAAVNRRNRRVQWFAALRSSAQPPDAPAFHAAMILTAALAAERPRERAHADRGRPAGPAVPAGVAAQGGGPEVPADAARRLRQQVDDLLNAGDGGFGAAPNATGRHRLVPEPPYPYRPPYDVPPPPNIGGSRIAVAVALLALTAAVGTASRTSAAEGIAVGGVLAVTALVLGLSSRWRRTRFASGLLGAVSGSLLGAPVAAGLGWAADLAAGPAVAWPAFWISWMLAVFAGATLGASPTDH